MHKQKTNLLIKPRPATLKVLLVGLSSALRPSSFKSSSASGANDTAEQLSPLFPNLSETSGFTAAHRARFMRPLRDVVTFFRVRAVVRTYISNQLTTYSQICLPIDGSRSRLRATDKNTAFCIVSEKSGEVFSARQAYPKDIFVCGYIAAMSPDCRLEKCIAQRVCRSDMEES